MGTALVIKLLKFGNLLVIAGVGMMGGSTGSAPGVLEADGGQNIP